MNARTPKDDPWLTTPQLAERLHLKVQTLHDWAYKGLGPKFAKVGRRRLYRLSSVLEWEHRQEAS